jgi:hypothetical protein
MAVSGVVIKAYRRLYTQAQLEAALKQALADRAAGVHVTQVNFQDGGGSGQMIGGDPNEVIEILELTLQSIEADANTGSGVPGLASSVNFAFRRSET